MVLDKLYGFSRIPLGELGLVRRILDHFLLMKQERIGISVVIAGQDAEVVVKPMPIGMKGRSRSQMPFPDKGSDVTIFLKEFADEDFIRVNSKG